jgi:hypothetical protein
MLSQGTRDRVLDGNSPATRTKNDQIRNISRERNFVLDRTICGVHTDPIIKRADLSCSEIKNA